MVERLGLGECVHFRGAVFAEARLQLLCRADLSVLPRCGTGLLQSLHYGLLAGVPVIAAQRLGRRRDRRQGARAAAALCAPEEYAGALCRLVLGRCLLGQMRAARLGWREVRPRRLDALGAGQVVELEAADGDAERGIRA